jgi:uncharacterized membrane protein HdeD (DUF308 family)
MMILPFFLGKQGKTLLLLGALLMLFGVIVATNPEILVWIVSSFFIFLGAVLFTIGLSLYQQQKKMRASSGPFMEYLSDWQRK